MRISEISTAIVELPLAKPLRTSIHHIEAVSCLLLTLKTDEGLTGEGYAFGFNSAGMRAVQELLSGLEDLIVGADPTAPEALWGSMYGALNFYGSAGLTVIAMTPVDVACWDILGKVAGQPLYRLFGGSGAAVPAYASGGLWLSLSTDELVAEARDFVGAGFKAMKMRLGSARIGDDIARIDAVRSAIGPEIRLMADANQGLSRSHALRLGRELERFDLTWFEEPVPTWDHAGHAQIAAALDTPIASGETEYLRFGIAQMIAAGAADILMPDLQRMGGYTEFRRVIGQLAAAGIPFSPHIFTEHSLHLCGASGALYVEHMPWFQPLFREKLILDGDGNLALPQGPGIGFTFDWDRLESLRV